MNIYKNKTYLGFTAIAILLFVVSLFLIPHIKLGIEFKGGSLITIDTKKDVNINLVKESLMKNGFNEIKITKFKTPFGYRIEIEIPNTESIEKAEKMKGRFQILINEWSKKIGKGENYTNIKTEIDNIMEKMSQISKINFKRSENPNDYIKSFSKMYSHIKNDYQKNIENIIKSYISAESFKFQTVTPSLSESFIEKAKGAAIASILISILIVFFIFRNIGPSIAVIIGALSDIVTSLGGMVVFGIPLTLPSFAALLMLIGYSLDTDILLTTRVLKRKGDIRENAFEALKTGLTMTLTGLLSFSVIYITSHILRISLYNQIASIALIGLIGDIFTTWGINAVLLIHFAKKEG